MTELDGLAGRHVLLGVSGGIAAYKAAALARGLRKAGATVQAVLTESAAEFVGPATFEALTGRSAPVGVFTDVHRILHVRLAREADVAIFAPATANLIAKFAHGLADDLVTNIYTCLTCPVVVAPAMHTEMWEHQPNMENVQTLRSHGVHIVGPDSGQLAGGDEGPGRLVDEDVLLQAVADAVGDRSRSGSLAGRRVVVTAGGTREPIDPVRFLTNRSSGKMGYALATEAARRGAQVELVTTASLPDPVGIAVHRVDTAVQMRDAVVALADEADLVVKAAAVADYRPAAYHDQKVKKTGSGLPSIELEPNPDILAELGELTAGRRAEGRPAPVLVGFAAETNLEEEHGRGKLERKQLDVIVINRVDGDDAGFEVDTNRVLILDADGGRAESGLVSKAQVATQVLDAAEARL